MKKKIIDINVADAALKIESYGDYKRLNCYKFVDTFEKDRDVRATRFDIGSQTFSTGSTTWGLYNDEIKNGNYFCIDFLSSVNAKRTRAALDYYNESIKQLYNFYYKHIYRESKSVTTTPLYFIDNHNINVDLKEGDIIVAKSDNKLKFLKVKNTTYNKINGSYFNEPKHSDYDGDFYDRFYEWLTETDSSYAVTIPGDIITFGLNGEVRFYKNSAEDFSLKSNPAGVLLVTGITWDILQERLISATHNINLKMVEIYKNEYGEDPGIETTVEFNGQKYAAWDNGNDIFAHGDKIKKLLICI